jgi:hypothetical protein
MKITTRELDVSLIEKIERLDGITSKFTSADKAGFVSYNGENFLITRVNEPFLNQVYTNNDISFLNDHTFIEGNFIKNSFKSNFNISNIANKNMPSLNFSVEEIQLVETSSKIKKVRKYNDAVLIMDETGSFHKYNFETKKLEFSLNMVEKIRKNFSIEKIQPIEFLDFEVYGNGFFVSTLYNGVFYADIANNNLEVKFSESNIVEIEDLGNNTLLLVHADGTMFIYNFEYGMKVETLNHLKKANHVFKGIYKDKRNLFILAASNYSNATDNLLYTWEIDPSGALNNITGLVSKGYNNQDYQLQSITGDAYNLYISGIKKGGKVFVWRYDRTDLSAPLTETLLPLEINHLDFIHATANEILINFDNNRLIGFDIQGNITKNLLLKTDKNLNKIMVKETGKELMSISDNFLSMYRIPEYRSDNDVLIQIYNASKSCNNIDVLIKSSGSIGATFVDAETKAFIEPFLKINTELGTVYKILNSTAKVINLMITNLSTAKVESIVVNSNEIYSK